MARLTGQISRPQGRHARYVKYARNSLTLQEVYYIDGFSTFGAVIRELMFRGH